MLGQFSHNSYQALLLLADIIRSRLTSLPVPRSRMPLIYVGNSLVTLDGCFVYTKFPLLYFTSLPPLNPIPSYAPHIDTCLGFLNAALPMSA